MIGARLDALLYRQLAGRRARAAAAWPDTLSWLDTAAGPLRVFDSGGERAPVLFVPDGPCSIEHYDELIGLLQGEFRVLVVDLPGFGFSPPRPDYTHELHEGALVIAAALEALALPPVTLVASCVNGFYALAAAQLARARIARLILCQTPSLHAMRDWSERIVPPVIKVPVIGQMLNYSGRRRIATAWCRSTVAEHTRRDAFADTARAVLRHGGCYCFAGVVQGMQRCAPEDPLLAPPEDLPVTAVWGTADRSHRRSAAGSLQTHCPQAELREFKSAGHFPELEAPEQFAGLLHASAAAG